MFVNLTCSFIGSQGSLSFNRETLLPWGTQKAVWLICEILGIAQVHSPLLPCWGGDEGG